LRSAPGALRQLLCRGAQIRSLAGFHVVGVIRNLETRTCRIRLRELFRSVPRKDVSRIPLPSLSNGVTRHDLH
jgi:hypothetical protein